MKPGTFVLSLLAFLSIGFAVPVSSCSEITSPGTYDLTSDVSGEPYPVSLPYGGNACFRIDSSDVILDCHGFDLVGTYVYGNSYGVAVESPLSNVEIRNCDITQYVYGIFSDVSTSLVVTNNSIHDNQIGAQLESCSNCSVEGNTFLDNIGNNQIYAEHGSGNNFTANSITLSTPSAWADGMQFYDESFDIVLLNNISFMGRGINVNSACSNMTFIGNNASNNSQYGLELGFSTNGTVRDNLFQDNGLVDIYLVGQDCSDVIVNNTGSRDMPIYYNNSAVLLQDSEFSELMLCGHGADGSSLQNVTVHGSDSVYNNGAFFNNVDYLVVNNSESSNNAYGFQCWGCNYAIFTNDTADYNYALEYYQPRGFGFSIGDSRYGFFDNLSAYGNNQYGFVIPDTDSGGHTVSNSIFQENQELDFMAWPTYPEYYCDYIISNITVSGDMPLDYYNESVVLSDITSPEILLCGTGASGSNLTNITLSGSPDVGNNAIVLMFVNDTSISNSESSWNYYGVYAWGGKNIEISNTTASYNGLAGFQIYYSENARILDSTAASEQYGVYLNGAGNATVSNNTMPLDSFGVMAVGGPNTTIINNNITDSGYSIMLGSTSGGNVSGNSIATAYGSCIYVYDITGAGISNNSADNCSSYAGAYGAIYLGYNSNGNTITDNALSGSNYGVSLETYFTGNNSISRNSIRNNSVGVYAQSGVHDNDVFNNSIANNSQYGVSLSYAGTGNLFRGNDMAGNLLRGFDLGYSSGNNFTGNRISGSSSGFSIVSSNLNHLSGNAIADVWTGIDISAASSGNVLQSSNITRSSAYALSLSNSAGTNISDLHFYNNSIDMRVLGPNVTFNSSGVIFDNPYGNITNYTNLSLYDSAGPEGYVLLWSPSPAPLPENLTSFNQKFVEISAFSGTPTLDSLTWHWDDSELAGFNESRLDLWGYSSGWYNVTSASLDEAANAIHVTALDPASVYAIVQDERLSTPPPEGPPSGDQDRRESLDASVDSSCEMNSVEVTSGDTPVSGSLVIVTDRSGSVLASGSTDGYGRFGFGGCGKNVSLHASKSGYLPASAEGALVSCSQCALPECSSDSECDAGRCSDGKCTAGPGPVPPPGQQCTAPACCVSDSQCADSQACLGANDSAGTSASPGSCKALTGCGHVEGHKLAPYECGPEAGCPSCSEGFTCVEHKCVQNDISCPTTGIVGDEKTCAATENGQACANCDFEVTDPSGKKSRGRTDEEGNFNLPLNLEGTYKVALLKDGKVIKTIDVKAFPQAAPEQPEKPPTAGTDAFPLLWLVVLVLLVMGAIFYWRRRGQKKKDTGKNG
ncbi:MAG: right-handed parallel beta-helix repeat-containing protein [Candidatus Micrarchaeota archaeon]